METRYHTIFSTPIEWVEVDDYKYSYSSNHEGRKLYIRVNPEFPDLPLYTLFIDDKNIDFDNWPEPWDR